MQELENEIVALIDKLEKANPLDGSTEQITIHHLRRLITALENAEETETNQGKIAELEQFYESSVPWCSQLSKDIEKIVIIYQEQR